MKHNPTKFIGCLPRDEFIIEFLNLGWTQREAEREWDLLQDDEDELAFDDSETLG